MSTEGFLKEDVFTVSLCSTVGRAVNSEYNWEMDLL